MPPKCCNPPTDLRCGGVGIGRLMARVGRCVSCMDSKVLWKAVMAACENREDRARQLPTK
jgi:hypothetical protein